MKTQNNLHNITTRCICISLIVEWCFTISMCYNTGAGAVPDAIAPVQVLQHWCYSTGAGATTLMLYHWCRCYNTDAIAPVQVQCTVFASFFTPGTGKFPGVRADNLFSEKLFLCGRQHVWWRYPVLSTFLYPFLRCVKKVYARNSSAVHYNRAFRFLQVSFHKCNTFFTLFHNDSNCLTQF